MSATNPERMKRAKKIVSQPTHYKVCEQCDSIVAQKAVHCPNCRGYRFNSDPAAVVAQARLLAQREQTSVTEQDME